MSKRNQTKATKQQIYQACELLETHKENFSCHALEMATTGSRRSETTSIDYTRFYNMQGNQDWYGGRSFFDWDEDEHYDSYARPARIMALLLYLEARNDVGNH